MTDVGAPRGPRTSETLLAAALAVAGWLFCLYLLYPGIASYDALSVYDQANSGDYGDWQPPLFGVLWVWLEHLFGLGPAAINLPTITLYWLAFFLIFMALRKAGTRLAWLALILPLTPPLLVIQGVVWRDVVFSTLWLLAFAIAFLAADRPPRLRWPATILALVFFLLGFWLRPNALFAAVPLFVCIVWPRDFRWKRLAFVAIPLCIVLQGSSGLINYSWLKAKEFHPTHSIMVFDLGGISHFTGQNVFPVTDWTPDEIRMATTNCYDPAYWDTMWWMRAECSFIMKSLDREVPGPRIFGTRVLTDAWIAAIVAHPVAYLQHRFAHFGVLMLGRTMVMFDRDNGSTPKFPFAGNQIWQAFRDAMHWLNDNTPLFFGLPWLILALATLAVGLVIPDGRARAAVLGLSLSGVIFTLTYLPFGVAAEYRYVYWTVFSGLVAGLIALAKRAADRTDRASSQGQDR